MIDPFQWHLSVYEKKAKLAGTISKMTKAKGRKYVMLSDLQSELGADDAEFEEVMSSARKSNRYSNKYIFADVDGAPAVGITAAKRGGKATKRDIESQDVGITGQGGEEVNIGDVSQTGSTDREGSDKPEDVSLVGKKDKLKEDQLWRAYKQGGWRGVEKVQPLPDNLRAMSVTEAIEQMSIGSYVVEGLKWNEINWPSLLKKVSNVQGVSALKSGKGYKFYVVGYGDYEIWDNGGEINLIKKVHHRSSIPYDTGWEREQSLAFTALELEKAIKSMKGR